jgi:IMP dehydrogenase
MRLVQQSLTFDDVLLLPAYSEVLPSTVSLRTELTAKLCLNIPLLSAAMDTVTEARLAIALAQEGGIGIIHKNLTIEAQTREVKKVKKHESGIVRQPITIDSTATIGEVIALTKHKGISGVPVVDDGELMGMVTGRDIRFETNLSARVGDVMTPKAKLVTATEGTDNKEILKLMHEYRIEKVLIVNDAFELTGLITAKDIQKNTDFPNASKDAQGRLLAGAAVGALGDGDERVASLAEVGVDVLVVDSAHGHSKGILDRVKWIKQNYPEIQVIGGNIATAAAAKALADAGADAVKVGIGPGSICTTRIVAGVGVPQITALANVTEALQGTSVKVIADGGIRFSGDIAKAIAAGANAVMIGGLLAGTDESPGEVEIYQGRTYKAYRGMGSLGAMSQGSSDRYFQSGTKSDKLVPEGVEGRVPYKGTMGNIVHQLMGGLRSSMGYCGAKDIDTMRNTAEFTQITNAGMSESHVHDVTITREPPNYSR